MLDTRTFFAGLVESSFATLEDPDKLVAFVGRLKEERADHQHAKPEIRIGGQEDLRPVGEQSGSV